jgi:hypothetical protein
VWKKQYDPYQWRKQKKPDLKNLTPGKYPKEHIQYYNVTLARLHTSSLRMVEDRNM